MKGNGAMDPGTFVIMIMNTREGPWRDGGRRHNAG
jgi:hypothetical protein